MTSPSALITGGSSGIGLAIAGALADHGYSITIAARDARRLRRAATSLGGAGRHVREVQCDVSDAAAIDDLVADHHASFGGLDVVISNAGCDVERPLRDQTLDDIDRQVSVNLRGCCVLARACVPLLEAAAEAGGNPLLVHVASIAGKMGRPEGAVYSATKAGLVALSQALHYELSGSGVQVTALCPEWVRTPMSRHETNIPARDMIQPLDLAEAVLFLLRVGPSCHIPEIQIARRGGPLL